MPKGIYERKTNPAVNLGVRKTKSPEERFWTKVRKTESCWLWTAAKDQKGYGKLQVGTMKRPRYVVASRLSWEIHEGPIPPGIFVLHRCDEPSCVRPDHLFLGRAADNAADKVRKGRQTKGSRNPSAKLTEAQVAEIKAMDWGITSQAAVARRYGVSHVAIWKIVNGKTWT